MKLLQDFMPERPSFQPPSLHIGFWVVLLLGVFAWAPATYPGYWQALEGFIPVFEAVQASPLPVSASSTDLWRSSGGATYLLVRPLLLVGVDGVTAVRIGFIIYMVLGGLGIYVWLQQRLGDRAAGLAGLLYMLSPPLLATVYLRGSLSDMTIVALLPLALAGLTSYCDTRSLSAAGIGVIAIWWMWQAQAGLAACATLLLLLYILVVERNWVVGLIVTLSGATGLAGLATQLTEWGTFGAGQQATPITFNEHFVAFFQFFTDGWQRAPSVAGWQDGYPLQLGGAFVIFTILTFWLWGMTRARQAPITNRLFTFSFGGTILLLLLCTELSEPLWRWSGADKLLTYPWQLQLVALPLLAITASGLPALQLTLRQTPYWLTMLLLTIFSSAPYLKADYTQFAPPTVPLAFFGPHDNVAILALSLTESRQPHSAEIAVTWQTLQPLRADYNIFFQALSAEPTDGPATTKNLGNGKEQGIDENKLDHATTASVSEDVSTLTVVSQLDQQPFAGALPATQWQLGTIYTDTYQLDLTAVPAGEPLIYYFGYYDWRDGTRLPVNRGMDDKLIFYGK